VLRQCPSHVTLRLRRGTPGRRSRRFLRELRPSLRRACERRGFRVVHYCVQRNHLHLLVVSAGKEALGRGMKAILARVARAAQRAFGLSGPVHHGRYHLRILRTPREVRSAMGAHSPSASTRPPRAAGSKAGGGTGSSIRRRFRGAECERTGALRTESGGAFRQGDRRRT
jgi:REP element-mobilizing transposase RayT